jgi:hypothetical protein
MNKTEEACFAGVRPRPGDGPAGMYDKKRISQGRVSIAPKGKWKCGRGTHV